MSSRTAKNYTRSRTTPTLKSSVRPNLRKAKSYKPNSTSVRSNSKTPIYNTVNRKRRQTPVYNTVNRNRRETPVYNTVNRNRRTFHTDSGVTQQAVVTLHDDAPATHSYQSGHRGSSFGVTLGREFDHFTGLLHIGRQDGHTSVQGALIYRNNNDHYYGHGYNRYYGSGHYYNHYSPFDNHHYGYDPYYSHQGYYYSSLYYHRPVVYRFYDPQYFYVDDDIDYVNEITIINNTVDSGPYRTSGTSAVMGPPMPTTVINNANDDYAVIDDPMKAHPVERGGVAFANGDYKQAKSFFAQAMLSDERDGYAKLLYAVSGFAMGEYDLASIALRRALMTTDLLIDRPLDVRNLYKDLHQYDMQMDRLKRYVADHLKDRETRFLLGYLNYATGRQEPAVAIFGALSIENQEDLLSAKLLKAVSLAKPYNDPPS